MKKFDYKSEKEWCIAFQTIEDAGIEPPKEMLEQYAIFTATQNSSSIFDTLRSISKFPYSAELVECITSTVDNLLINSENAIEPGLLLGKIQCGKTNAFENIIGLSFDRGIDVCVVLTKGTNTLAYQTIERLRYDFRHFKETNKLDQPVIVEINDIKELIGRGLTANQVNRQGLKRIIVCMKQAVNMQHLIDLFKKDTPELKQKRIIAVR